MDNDSVSSMIIIPSYNLGNLLTELPCGDVSHNQQTHACQNAKFLLVDLWTWTGFFVHSGSKSIPLDRASPLNKRQMKIVHMLQGAGFKRIGQGYAYDSKDLTSPSIEEEIEYMKMEGLLMSARKSVETEEQLSSKPGSGSSSVTKGSQSMVTQSQKESTKMMQDFLSGFAGETSLPPIIPTGTSTSKKSLPEEPSSKDAKSRAQRAAFIPNFAQNTPPTEISLEARKDFQLIVVNDHPRLQASLADWPCGDVAHCKQAWECYHGEKCLLLDVQEGKGVIVHRGSVSPPEVRKRFLNFDQKRAANFIICAQKEGQGKPGAGLMDGIQSDKAKVLELPRLKTWKVGMAHDKSAKLEPAPIDVKETHQNTIEWRDTGNLELVVLNKHPALKVLFSHAPCGDPSHIHLNYGCTHKDKCVFVNPRHWTAGVVHEGTNVVSNLRMVFLTDAQKTAYMDNNDLARQRMSNLMAAGYRGLQDKVSKNLKVETSEGAKVKPAEAEAETLEPMKFWEARSESVEVKSAKISPATTMFFPDEAERREVTQKALNQALLARERVVAPKVTVAPVILESGPQGPEVVAPEVVGAEKAALIVKTPEVKPKGSKGPHGGNKSTSRLKLTVRGPVATAPKAATPVPAKATAGSGETEDDDWEVVDGEEAKESEYAFVTKSTAEIIHLGD